jgi:hypothetical protein
MPTLCISGLACRHLAPAGKKGPNTFVIMDVDGKSVRTAVVKGQADPAWPEVFNVHVDAPRQCVVRFLILAEGLLENKTLGTHMTTIGHLLRGQPAPAAARLSPAASFSYTLTARDFGAAPPPIAPPRVPSTSRPLSKTWSCRTCGNVNMAEAPGCLRCGVPLGLATVTRPLTA